eukprot:TRINITY_DN9699_c0_g1_i6.p1 TRINITY_DN9699_c0_g1~~TRINITY_DN9699_c0_g1_i6.p1  ORF type:complete len:382 (-),score=75.82 TRINITY_DN9699_c0_g1_i6:232-1377(-)
MKRRIKNAPRQMWVAKEDQLLLETLKIPAKMTWNQIAETMTRRDPETTKTGKQCRERFRNYLDPAILEKPWTKNEKTLFILLHRHYQNHWGEIAKYYMGRSDISIKNLFYAYMRRVLKKVKNGFVLSDITAKPKKVLKMYYILSLINDKYLPTLERTRGEVPEIKNEKIMLELIKAKKVTKDEILSYMGRLISYCEDACKQQGSPLIVEVSLDEMDVDAFLKEALRDILLNLLFDKLSNFLRIKVVSTLKSPVLIKSEPLPISPPFVETQPDPYNKPKAFVMNGTAAFNRSFDSVSSQPLIAPPPASHCFLYSYNPFPVQSGAALHPSHLPYPSAARSGQLHGHYRVPQLYCGNYIELLLSGGFLGREIKNERRGGREGKS